MTARAVALVTAALLAACASGPQASDDTSEATVGEPTATTPEPVPAPEPSAVDPPPESVPESVASTVASTVAPTATDAPEPPPGAAERDALRSIAEATNATTIVATASDGRVVTWDEGVVDEVAVPTGERVWSDGAYVYWTSRAEDDPRWFAAGLDGTVVCEVVGDLRRVRERPDGGFVATVDRPEEATAVLPEYPIPRYAVDCATGAERAIEERAVHVEAGWREVAERGGRTFTFNYGPEGDGDVVNDRGISVNGDDYAGLHAFSPDAGVVVYGDYGGPLGPHLTETIRLRETVDGELLWSVELERTFGGLFVTDDWVVVAAPPLANEYAPWEATEYLDIFDVATGERILRHPTTIDLIHLS